MILFYLTILAMLPLHSRQLVPVQGFGFLSPWITADMESRLKVRKQTQFPLAQMGVLAPGSAHARPSAQPPIDSRGNLSAQLSGI